MAETRLYARAGSRSEQKGTSTIVILVSQISEAKDSSKAASPLEA